MKILKKLLPKYKIDVKQTVKRELPFYYVG